MLAPVCHESDRVESVAEAAEKTAGVDLGKLSRVTDEHDLRVGAAGVVEEASEGPGADHAGFVDHEHAASREAAMGGLVEPVEEARDGVDAIPAVASTSAAALAASEAPTTW